MCTSSSAFEIHLNCIRNAFKMHWKFGLHAKKPLFQLEMKWTCSKCTGIYCSNAIHRNILINTPNLSPTSSNGELQLFPRQLQTIGQNNWPKHLHIRCVCARARSEFYQVQVRYRDGHFALYLVCFDKIESHVSWTQWYYCVSDTFKSRVRRILLCIMRFCSRNTIIECPTNVPTIAFVWKSFSNEKLCVWITMTLKLNLNTKQNSTWWYSWLHFFLNSFLRWRCIHIDTVLMLITKYRLYYCRVIL